MEANGDGAGGRRRKNRSMERGLTALWWSVVEKWMVELYR
jgi:hypothetical protein